MHRPAPSNATLQSIPVVSLKAFTGGSPQDRTDFVNTLGGALTDLGFFSVEDHGVDMRLIDRCYAIAEEFFLMPTEKKLRYENLEDNCQRGYTSFGREHAKGSTASDLKEFWHVGRELPADHAFNKFNSKNIWPVEFPEFKSAFLELFRQIEACAMKLLEASALYLGESQDRFASIAENGNSILRVIHYPPVSSDRDPASIRAGAHEDINLITLLCEATTGGLELLQRDGQWRPIHALKGQIVVDSGDMIQNLTNGVLRSTTHRVVNPDNTRDRRFSMPFFVHPRSEASLNPLASCVKRVGSVAYRDITAGEYLMERLREIGLT
ncbi:MAG: isopenicillin N synthase family oxygenase [Proteobacteria bacterium]|nr:isopenicillin N synthase family oxygenase [Pseudomonadota bacterium]